MQMDGQTQLSGTIDQGICIVRPPAASFVRHGRGGFDMASNPSSGFEFNRPTIVALLYLLGAVTGVAAIVGLVLAYVWKGESHEPWEATHYTYMIRTFWIGLVVCIIGAVTTIIGIGFLILLAVTVWVIVRSIMSLLNAQKRAPMPDPATFLI
jgi:uncharacterized membrane protein